MGRANKTARVEAGKRFDGENYLREKLFRVGEKAANSLNHICQCFISTKAKLGRSLSLRLNFDLLANKEGIFLIAPYVAQRLVLKIILTALF